jgi:hypothetical protein
MFDSLVKSDGNKLRPGDGRAASAVEEAAGTYS